jgi:hypothetical protein
MGQPNVVMPGLVPGIHVLSGGVSSDVIGPRAVTTSSFALLYSIPLIRFAKQEDVDGRDKPGHDDRKKS